MEIKTKFSIDQLVWFVYENKIHKGIVSNISILVFKGHQSEKYGIALGSSIIDRPSDTIFSSKETLVENIS